MAYEKPLKMQWITVNGRSVPLVLPQYWSEDQDDWVVSSEQNRLPVDAQLTGSLIEYKQIANNVVVSAGSFGLITSLIEPAKGATKIRIFIQGANTYTDLLMRWPILDGYARKRVNNEDLIGDGGLKWFEFDIVTDAYAIELVNTDTVDHTYNVYVSLFA